MPAAPTYTVEGLPQLRRQLRQLVGNLDDLKAANAAVASFVAGVASSRAPRRSGRLAASVRGNRAAGRASVSAGGASLPYAGPIHYGWPSRGIEGTPFVSDAAQDTEATWLAMYEHDVRQAVEGVR